jgi:hypothetical protein
VLNQIRAADTPILNYSCMGCDPVLYYSESPLQLRVPGVPTILEARKGVDDDKKNAGQAG